MKKRQNLYLITDGFPFGRGEKPFILPELPYLLEKYQVTIISPAPKEVSKDVENITTLDSRIRLIHLPYEPLRINQEMERKYREHPILQEEFEIIEKEGHLVEEKKLDALIYFAMAELFFQQIVVSGAVNFRKSGVIYTYWYTFRTLAFALHKEKYPNLKLITRTHGYDLYNYRANNGRHPFRTFMQRVLHGIFFVSHKGLDYYQKTFMREDSLKLHYCPLGVCKASNMHVVPSELHVFQLVSCSNAIPLKRIDLILGALALCGSDIKIHWTHFGDGPQIREIYELAIKELSGKKHIRVNFMGHRPNEEIMKFYASNYVDCFITTSSSEGLPVSIQEALSYGIPIIGTNVGGIHEEIDGNGVLLSENPSAEEIRDAICLV